MNFLKTTIASVSIDHNVSIDGNSMTYCLNPTAESPITSSVNLADVVARSSQDHGVIAVGENAGEALVVETTAISIGYRGSPFVNTYGAARRDSPLSVYRSFTPESFGWPATFILTPYRGCALSDCTLFFCVAEGQGTITVDGQPLNAQEAPLLPAYLKTWQPISFTGGNQVSSGGSIQLTVVAPQGTEVYLEALAGTLSQIRARNGDTVVFSAIDLPAGMQARIKAGYRYWPGQTDFIVNVV